MTAELGALELAAAHAPPDYRPDPQRAPHIVAGRYLHTVRAIGSSPADSPAAIAAADPGSRAAADGVLLALEGPKAVPLASARPSPLAPAPTVMEITSGSQAQNGSCIDLTPQSGAPMTSVLVLPNAGVTIRSQGNSPASLAYRRFGEPFVPSSGSVPPRTTTAILLPSDAAAVPWQMQVTSLSPVVVCGLLA